MRGFRDSSVSPANNEPARLAKAILVVLFLVLVIPGGLDLYRHRHFDIPVVAGPGVTRGLNEFNRGGRAPAGAGPAARVSQPDPNERSH